MMVLIAMLIKMMININIFNQRRCISLWNYEYVHWLWLDIYLKVGL